MKARGSNEGQSEGQRVKVKARGSNLLSEGQRVKSFILTSHEAFINTMSTLKTLRNTQKLM